MSFLNKMKRFAEVELQTTQRRPQLKQQQFLYSDSVEQYPQEDPMFMTKSVVHQSSPTQKPPPHNATTNAYLKELVSPVKKISSFMEPESSITSTFARLGLPESRQLWALEHRRTSPIQKCEQKDEADDYDFTTTQPVQIQTKPKQAAANKAETQLKAELNDKYVDNVSTLSTSQSKLTKKQALAHQPKMEEKPQPSDSEGDQITEILPAQLVKSLFKSKGVEMQKSALKPQMVSQKEPSQPIFNAKQPTQQNIYATYSDASLTEKNDSLIQNELIPIQKPAVQSPNLHKKEVIQKESQKSTAQAYQVSTFEWPKPSKPVVEHVAQVNRLDFLKKSKKEQSTEEEVPEPRLKINVQQQLIQQLNLIMKRFQTSIQQAETSFYTARYKIDTIVEQKIKMLTEQVHSQNALIMRNYREIRRLGHEQLVYAVIWNQFTEKMDYKQVTDVLYQHQLVGKASEFRLKVIEFSKKTGVDGVQLFIEDLLMNCQKAFAPIEKQQQIDKQQHSFEIDLDSMRESTFEKQIAPDSIYNGEKERVVKFSQSVKGVRYPK